MPRLPKSARQVDALKHDAATRKNIPTAEMESFFRRDEDSSPMPPKHYPRARPLAEGQTRTKEEPSKPELIWNGAKITITDAQMKELSETGTLTLSDAQLVWRGKDSQDWSDLVVNVPPLYIQEKIHPKAIIDSLRRYPARGSRQQAVGKSAGDATAYRPLPTAYQPDLFADFNGIAPDQRAEFYGHDGHWSNRMILGDSLQVMASLAERESLRGKVQCIYFDPPYGIKFNSNWQVSTQSRDVKDGKQQDISREPEQVKAFRDTWKDGIHSYLTYLRDRLTVMRDLLTESGSIFVQIGDENVHRVRAVMDEVFGENNFISQISFKKTSGSGAAHIENIYDIIVWYGKSADALKFRRPYKDKPDELFSSQYSGSDDLRACFGLGDPRFMPDTISSQGASEAGTYPITLDGKQYSLPANTHWKASRAGMPRLAKARRLVGIGQRIRYRRYASDFPVVTFPNVWDDTIISGYADPKTYIVQTSPKVIERCILMATDPGDLVLDPTCGSGTTAYVAEQWGRRWITIDTSRVALALARTRLMAARYPWYLLADSREGRTKEAQLTGRIARPSLREGEADEAIQGGGEAGLLRSARNDGEARNGGEDHGTGDVGLDSRLRGNEPSNRPDDIRQGFVYERVPHITLKSIANNPRIDDIWEKWQSVLEPLRAALNDAMGRGSPPPSATGEGDHPQGGGGGARASSPPPPRVARSPYPEGAGEEKPWEEWQIPRELPAGAPAPAKQAHERWWEARIARQREIDASIAARADVEYLYDKPYTDSARVRVAGPFTVESLSPHRALPASEEELIDELDAAEGRRSPAAADLAGQDFSAIVIDYLKAEGVKQQAKGDRIGFESITPWPGNFIGASATFVEGENGPVRRAAILIGPEYGTVGRQDIVAAAREAVDARFDVLIACAFNFDAHSSELGSLGSLKILKARINPDMHMSEELKNTGRGNMFVVFGEPDVTILDEGGPEIRVKVNGVDVFDPNTGDIRSNDTDGIAAWFIDIDYNEESFFVRHAYFLGANDPYKSLKTALQAEIDEDAWATLYSDTSRPFDRPAGGRIAVKVINHFGDEVMKVFGV